MCLVKNHTEASLKNLISHLLMDHRTPPVWCHLMSLDFRLSLKFNHLINIITIARENGKNMKNKTLLK